MASKLLQDVFLDLVQYMLRGQVVLLAQGDHGEVQYVWQNR